MKVCVCRCRTWKSAPMAFQWHGRTSVSGHFPSDKLESANEMCCGYKTRTRATASAQCMKALKNMRAVLLFVYTSRSDREGLSPTSRLRSPEAGCVLSKDLPARCAPQSSDALFATNLSLLPPNVLQLNFFQITLPQEPSQRMIVKVNLKRNHRIFNSVPSSWTTIARPKKQSTMKSGILKKCDVPVDVCWCLCGGMCLGVACAVGRVVPCGVVWCGVVWIVCCAVGCRRCDTLL